jgi:AmmeMemoRadiSam system protein A
MLDNSDKDALLKFARLTLEARLNKAKAPTMDALSEELLSRKGAFVSLHRNKELRGCIGQIYTDQELYRVVQHCVLSAAFEDGRFSVVTLDELADLEIEISVLSPLHRIRSIEEIEVGRHGLYLVQERYRGLLLPQVATEYGWDRNEFLEHTCLKAGLPRSAWQDPQTVIYVFEAEIFSENRLSEESIQEPSS